MISLIEMPLNVVIVGAGVGGLCAAVALRKGNHKVTVSLVLSAGNRTIPTNLGLDSRKVKMQGGDRCREF